MKIALVFFLVLLIPVVSLAEETVYPVETVFLLPHKSAIHYQGIRISVGTPLSVIGADYTWYYVETKEGKRGYIKKNKVTDVPTITQDKNVKEKSVSNKEYEIVEQKNVSPKYTINIFKSPGFNGEKVSTASIGDHLLVIGKRDFWYRIKIKNQEGWVAQSWVTDDVELIKSLKENRRQQEEKRKEQERQKAAIEKEQERKQVEIEKREIEKKIEGYSIKLINWNWNLDHGYAIAQGQVKNISDRKIQNLQVVVSWLDKDKNLITYRSSYVEYTALMPNQITPFRVMDRYNPLMKKAAINFMVNGSIMRWYKD